MPDNYRLMRLPAGAHSLKIRSTDNMQYKLAINPPSLNKASIAHLLSVGLLIERPGFESGREISFLLKTLENS